MGIDRRGLLAGVAASASIAAIRHASAQEKSGVIMLAFAGGTSNAWKKFYVEPYVAQTHKAARVVEMTDPVPWYMGRGSEFNCSIANGVDYLFYQRGKIEAIAIEDFPVLRSIPEKYWVKVDDKHLLGMPVYQQVYAIAYNKDLVKPGEITSWTDLADPKFKGKIAVGNFSDIYEVPWFSKMIGSGEKDTKVGLEFYAKVMKNALTVPGTMSQLVQLLERGDVAMAPLYSSRIWEALNRGDTKIGVAFPKEGVPLIPYHLQLSKTGPDLAAAKDFMNFAAQSGASEKAAETSGYFPVNSEAKFPANFKDLLGVSREQYDALLRPMDYIAIGQQRLALRDQIDQIHASLR